MEIFIRSLNPADKPSCFFMLLHLDSINHGCFLPLWREREQTDGISDTHFLMSPLSDRCHAATLGTNTARKNPLEGSGWQQEGSDSLQTLPVSFPSLQELHFFPEKNPFTSERLSLSLVLEIHERNESLIQEMKPPWAKPSVCKHSLLPHTKTNPYRRPTPSPGISLTPRSVTESGLWWR